MSNTQPTSAPQRLGSQRNRRTSAVIAQYVQDLSQTARVRRRRPPLRSREPGAFPARVIPVPCS